jgi:hypothetical protein
MIPELNEAGLRTIASGKVEFRDLSFVNSTAPAG